MVVICRLCASLKKSESMTYIRDKDQVLCEKLFKCCQLKIELNNVLPRGVCSECVQCLNASFDFYERVHQSQESLEKLLNVQPESKKETEDLATIEEEALAEKRKSYDLISAASASQIQKPPMQVAVAKIADQLQKFHQLKEIDDSVNSENDKVDFIVQLEIPTQEIICPKNEIVERFVRKSGTEIYEVLSEGEEIIGTKSGEVLIPNNSEFVTAIEYIEDEVEEEVDYDSEPYEIIEFDDGSQSKEEQENRRDVYIPVQYLSEIETQDINHQNEDKAQVSGKVPWACPQMNISTWFGYPWKCVRCSQIFCTGLELLDHIEKVEQILPIWSCADCLKVFQKYYSLINHVRQRHRKYLALICDICNKKCNSFQELQNHRQSVHDNIHVNMIICLICGKGFNTSNSLQIHRKCHLPDDLRLRFNCNLCEKKFRSSSNLKFHQKMHAGLKDFICDHCGKKFIQRANLEEHLVTHIDFTPYECDLCNKFFKTSDRLTKHKKRHTDDKPFKCNSAGCNKTFRTKDAWISHSRIHTGEMPFQCEFCQKPFRFRSTLMTHHNVHTGVRPYSCNDCNHHFTNWPNYNKHMKRRHGIDVSSKNPRGKRPSHSKSSIPAKESIIEEIEKNEEAYYDVDQEEQRGGLFKAEKLEDVDAHNEYNLKDDFDSTKPNQEKKTSDFFYEDDF